MIGVLVGRLALLLFWVVTLPWRILQRVRSRVPAGTYLVAEIDGPVAELAPHAPAWVMRRARVFSVHDLGRAISRMTHDGRVRGVLLVVKSLRCGYATAASLRAALARAKDAGKEVVVHLPRGGGTREAYVATIADRVVLGPLATLAPVGVLSVSRYLRGALDRAGVVPEVHARGRFKTAAERFERTSMSDAQREQIGALLDGLESQLLAAVAQGRRVDPARARALVDGAPYAGEEAVTAGWVDAVAYDDQIPRVLSAEDSPSPLRRLDRYARGREALRCRALQTAGVLAVVRVHGAIVSSGGLPLRGLAVDDRVNAALHVAATHPRVRGVVLLVDSPGGSALASDRIHHQVERLAAKKPVVACMGDMAASGGYYVAAAAHEIIARPLTITGSIGVVAARLIVAPLLTRLGVASETLQRGARARLLDPTLALDEEDRRAIDREIEHTYQAFLQVVARGRRRPVEEIEPLAQGRVWSGEEAHARGLVDRLGGFDDAIEALRQRVGSGAHRLEVALLEPPRRPVPWLSFAQTAPNRTTAAGAIESITEALEIDVRPLTMAGERVLLWSDVAASVR